MADTFFERLSAAVMARGPLCVGLDPSGPLVTAWGLDDDAAGVERLARTTIEATAQLAAVVKCQVAFFERHGAKGFEVLERVMAHAREAGLLVIADAKRGDIAPTNAGYAEAWLQDDRPLAADAVTVSCYLGARALMPVFTAAHETGRCALAVVASSNEEGRTIQTALDASGEPVDAALVKELQAISAELDGDGGARRSIGAVIGAHRRVGGIETFDGPVLVTGLGAQGHDTAEVAALRATLCHEAVAVNVSRSLLMHGPSREQLRAAAARYAEELR